MIKFATSFVRVMLNERQSKSTLTLIAASGVGALLLVVLAAVWAGAESDIAALERQRQLVTARLNDQVTQVAHDIGLMATGYGSLLADFEDVDGRLRTATDGASSHMTSAAKFGDIVTRVFGYDKVFLVDASGDLSSGTDAQTLKRYKWVRPLLTTMLRDVQKKQLTNGSSIQPSDENRRNFASAALMRLEGRPSITGIIPVNANDGGGSSTDAKPRRGQHYLIAFRFLDGPALDALSREQGLNGARFSRTIDADPQEVAFQIEATASREPIGFIIWTPDLPGSRVIQRLAPALSIATILVAGLFSTLIIRLRRSWRELEVSEQNARHLSLRDVLTKLPNRALLTQSLDNEHSRLRSSNGSALVAFIDLDRFKAVNDSYGHAAGDELILSAAGRMELLLGPFDVLARVGGDEFALLLPTPAAGDAIRFEVCDTLVKELSRPFILRGGQVITQIGCSVGMAVLLNDGQPPLEILRQADVALYHAKSSGRGRCSRYDSSMDHDRLDRARLIEDLRNELEDTFSGKNGWHTSTSNLEVFFQTIHRAGVQNETSGAEALIRWQHPTRGLLTPDKFIPLAEDSGLIDLVGRFVLASSCATATSWGEDQMVAVNISPKQLKRFDFAEEVLSILEKTGLRPSRLELELTETALLESAAQARVTLENLRRHGVKVALDDFGTGYSSLSHLIEFGIDRIKIDRSFVRLIDTKSDGAAIISAIAGLARNLGISTTAEGVETEGQRDFLTALGCNDLQGYLFSKPSPVSELMLGNLHERFA